MKATLSFNLPEESEEHLDALNGAKYKYQLDEVWNKVFRPRHKHLYNNVELNKLLESEEVNKAMDILEDLYREAINED